MINYTILKEEHLKWDEQKRLFFSEIDNNVFKLEGNPVDASLDNYWVAKSAEGEVLGYASLFCKEEVSVCVKANYQNGENRIGTNLLNKVERDTKDMGISKLTVVVESENDIAASIVECTRTSSFRASSSSDKLEITSNLDPLFLRPPLLLCNFLDAERTIISANIPLNLI